MRFVLSVLAVFERYGTFDGRAGRSEFWWYELFLIIVFGFTTVIDIAFNTLAFAVFAGLGLIVPTLSVAVRRLHDTSRSGLWVLVALVPIAGYLSLLVWAAQRGDSDDNAYGPPPRHPAAVA